MFQKANQQEPQHSWSSSQGLRKDLQTSGSVGDSVGAGSVGAGVAVGSGAGLGAELGADEGEGVGGGLELMSSSVFNRMFGEFLPTSSMTPSTPSDNIADFTSNGVFEGSCSKYRAATPAT